jgi:hypothetical protein
MLHRATEHGGSQKRRKTASTWACMRAHKGWLEVNLIGGHAYPRASAGRHRRSIASYCGIRDDLVGYCSRCSSIAGVQVRIYDQMCVITLYICSCSYLLRNDTCLEVPIDCSPSTANPDRGVSGASAERFDLGPHLCLASLATRSVANSSSASRFLGFLSRCACATTDPTTARAEMR